MYKAVRQHSWIVPILGIFGLVYAASLNLIYVEGDDVHMIAFHAAGRNRALLEHFVPYHSFLDAVLSLLPPSEPLLRMLAVATTSIAEVILVILLLSLVFDWLNITDLRFKWVASVVVLLTIPEVFYLGMVYLPSVTAMTGVVAAHLVLRRGVRLKADKLIDYWKRPSLYVALVLFGIGAASRWDIAVYGVVIAADLFFGSVPGETLTIQPFRLRFLLTLTWGLAAIVSVFAVIWITGYNPIEAFRELATVVDPNWNFGPRAPEYPLLIIGAGQIGSFFTPSTLLLILIGIVPLRSQHRALAIANLIAVILILVISPWWASGAAPKQIFPTFPAVMLCTVAGLQLLWQGFRRAWLTAALRAAVAVLIIGIWFIGIHVANPSDWGPGFELRAYDSPALSTRFWPVLGAGFEVFTTEGPRPLFGHAQVLLGGGWREVTNEWFEEQNLVVKTAMSMGIPELRIGPSFPNMAPYQAAGYKLVTSQDYFNKVFIVYNFTNATQQEARSIAVYQEWELTRERIDALRQAAGGDRVIVYGPSSKLRQLYSACPDMLQKVGKMSAIFDLTCFYKVFGATETAQK